MEIKLKLNGRAITASVDCDTILLDFLRDDRPYNDVVSPRMFDYLCTGKPIVSMIWPDQVERFPDVIYAAHNNQEFLTL